MAIYLGQTRVSPTLTKTVEKVITITNIQDQQGNIISTSQTETQNISGGATVEDPDNLTANLPVVTEWTRPSGWPNLDVLPVLDEGVYLTYDNTSKVDYKWACFYCDVQSSGQITIAQGHMNGNNFVQDASWNVNTATYKEINYSSSSYNYVVFKITPTTASKHITTQYFGRIAQATLGTYAVRPQQDQHCLERRGWLHYLTGTAGSGDNLRYCTEWMEHDNVEWGNAVTNLACAWYRARRLKKVEFGNWTGENCNITGLNSMFEQCNTIEKLDLSCWNTSNWHPSTLSSMFYACYMLKELNVHWNTTNWGAASNRSITLAYTFGYCRSLENLDLSSWDVSGWNNTSLYLTWICDYRLKSLNVSNWNTTNWHVTTLYEAWDQCFSLVNIDLSNWNTTNWTVTNLAYCFRGNRRRRNFNDIKNWNTTNWRPTTMYCMFESCYAVQEIDLSLWDVSEWPVTDLGAVWSNCIALRTLKVGTWNMTKSGKWAVTSIYALFNNCNSLETTEFYNWHPVNWRITRVGSAFYGCSKLQEIDFTKWQGATWDLVDGTSHGNYIAGYCYDAKKIDLTPLNFTNITVNNYGSNGTSYTNVMECYNLETLNLPTTFRGKLNLRYNYLLSRNEIVKIFNALPTALSGATIIITEMRYKLTTADIAIATNKGYTVS